MSIDPQTEGLTPLMKQFSRLKQEAGDAVLFFRMGDFYELFGPDAVLAAPILGITLTSRDKNKPNPTPMAGIPYHSATNYIQKLLNAGKKVAIAEQVVPEGMTIDQIKGIVDRKLVRTFSPAVQFELGSETGARFLATLNQEGLKNFILTLFDPATGNVFISKAMSATDLMQEHALHSVKHFLNASSKTPPALLALVDSLPQALIEEIPANLIAQVEVLPFLQTQYGKLALHPLLELETARRGLALLIQYVIKTQGVARLPHLKEPKSLHESNRLKLGPHTLTHLDTDDLFTLVNRCATSMGSRFLRGELEAPLKDVSEISERQEAIKALCQSSLEAARMQEHLKSVYDLDRILSRISTRLANPRDVYALATSLKSAFHLSDLGSFKASELKRLNEAWQVAKSALEPLADHILKTHCDDAPTHVRDGGIFKLGADATLDHLIKLTTEGERFLIELETREREQTGISSLKVKYNRVFGYFIEISSANLKNVPAHYQRKQTTVGGERFFTEELKKFEEEILSAGQKQKSLEAKLFEQVTESLIERADALKLLSQTLAELDGFISLSQLGQSRGWCFPVIDDAFHFELSGSRHPVVDHALKGEFVANDIELSPNTARTLVITGPNMGGKSTLMRQMAQIILLGQMGAPVPAKKASWGVFHSIYTRIGAQDAIAKGQSTFMVEMVELAHILSHADARSFIVLDEIGRGTSTFDGMSVAHASLEYLHNQSGARIVFATHYHELTELEAKLPFLKNAFMKVLDDQGKLTFLYELALGRSSKSFGIQVAELAGLPKTVIKNAWQILKQLEDNHLNQHAGETQMSLFSASNDHLEPGDWREIAPVEASQVGLSQKQLQEIDEAQAIREELSSFDLDSMRPIEALNYLEKLRERMLR